MFPDGKYADQAREKIEKIENEKWQSALIENSINGFKNYLDDFPKSKIQTMLKRK